MKPTQLWIALAAAALLTLVGPGVRSGATPAGQSQLGPVAWEAAQTQGWIVRAADNVCGLRDARQLSNPAQVDFSALLEETDEMKRLRRERIDPNSPQGIQLRDAARSKVATACEAVMQAQGHCSIWSAIRHSDGRTVTDVTDLVRQRM